MHFFLLLLLTSWPQGWASCPQGWESWPQGLGVLTPGLGQLTPGLGELTPGLGELTAGSGELTRKVGRVSTKAGAERRSCTNPFNARAHGSQEPSSTEHDDHTSRGDTALSNKGWLHDVGGAPWRNTRRVAAPLKSSVLVSEGGCETRVKKVGYSRLCRLVTTTGYVSWLRRLVTSAGYGEWLRWWWIDAHGVETIEVETKTGRYEMTKGRDDVS